MRLEHLQHLSPSQHLALQVVHTHCGDGLQEGVAGLWMSIQPCLGSAQGGAATTFYHVGHQRPLQGGRGWGMMAMKGTIGY